MSLVVLIAPPILFLVGRMAKLESWIVQSLTLAASEGRWNDGISTPLIRDEPKKR